ncbi:methylmalonyl-CoA decarboxylase, gamma subunit [Bacteroidetes oral taxon 274 str. F0058]|nr:methylmalonyl-CoA decarboxylase, gamma subunit [Bacteroidetes oral taxon 274 str. F0058]
MTQFKFDINGSKYEVEIKSIDGSIAEVDVNGNLYQVNIEGDGQISAPVARPAAKPTPAAATTPAAKPAATPTAAPAEAAGKGSKTIKAPLPGSVLKVLVEPGTAFKEGDILMVMESMKMENNITAECSGTITKVVAPVGTSVLQDDVLFEHN